MADNWDLTAHRISQFTDMGGASAGAGGEPSLTGTGTLQPGTSVSIDLENAPPFTLMFLVNSITSSPTPFLGGVLYTTPFNNISTKTSTAMGKRSLSTTWAGGLPSGIDVFLQYIVQDASAPDGFTVSNSIKLTTP